MRSEWPGWSAGDIRATLAGTSRIWSQQTESMLTMIRVIDHIKGQRRVGWVSHGLNPSYGLVELRYAVTVLDRHRNAWSGIELLRQRDLVVGFLLPNDRAGVGSPLGCMFRGSCDVTASGEKAGDEDIFVKRFPMQPDPAQFDLFAFGGGCVQQPGKPGERDTQGPAVRQLDPHRVFVKSNASCRNGHAKPSEEDRGCLRSRAGYPKARSS